VTGLVFCHLLNDSSGSPRVLLGAIRALCRDGSPGRLLVGSEGRGVLEQCQLPITRYWYVRPARRLLKPFAFLASQASLLLALLRDRTIPKGAVIYVNTLLPFGAALYGKFTGRKVVYHVHEVSIAPRALRSLLCLVARRTSSANVYVSDAHARALPLPDVPAFTVHNALDEGMEAVAARSVHRWRPDGEFRVLMVGSLRDYKGVPEFLSLVASLEERADIRFDLVVNDDADEIERSCPGWSRHRSLRIHPRTEEVARFYAGASVVLNLSRVDLWIETFGLTVLEAMAFGVPVIVPPVGGPAELVSDGVQGFLVDSRDGPRLRERLLRLADDESLCRAMSEAGRRRAGDFSSRKFEEAIRNVLAIVRSAP
jgi:glycosyltransferase involved in cell wall biosynthesis